MFTHYNRLFQSVSEGVCMLNPDGYIIYSNPATTELTGYAEHELRNQPIFLLYPNEKDHIKVRYELDQAHKNGKLVTEGWKVKKDKSRFWAAITLNPFYNDQATLLGYCCLIRDASEQKNKQIQLHQREERFRLMVEGVRDYAIFMLDVNGYILTWNEGAKRTKGYTATEIIGKHFSTFYTQPDLESQKPARELEIAKATGKYEEEGWRVKKNGSLFWANVVITALFNDQNKLIGFSKVTRDLSERKEMQESLRLSEERYRSLVEQIIDYGIFMMDEKGCIVSWNEGAKRIKGYSEQEILGKYFTIFYPEEDILNDKPARELQIARETGRYEEEGWRLRKDGSIFWANVVITTIYNTSGTLIGFSKVTRDLTERKESEKALQESYNQQRLLADELKKINEELAASNEELAASNEEYAALNNELEKANELLLRSNESLQTFAYVASHDLQEPLRKIQQFGDLLKEQHKDSLGTGVDYLERMQSAASRMSLLIKDLLNFSRLSTKQDTSAIVSLETIIHQVLSTLDILIQEVEAQVVVLPLPTVSGNSTQLGQLFQNLISNALKFRRADVPPLIEIRSNTVPYSDLPLSVKPARLADKYYNIEVTDNGIGFDEKYLNRIFQIFQRLHTRSEYEGTGIGLAICEKVAVNHGGAITATSKPDEGSSFSVYLPVTADNPSR